jgi:DNA-binding beta-propeller fold protein YncE
VLVARGRIFVTQFLSDHTRLYSIDPTQPPGTATLLTDLPGLAEGIAYDGSRIWTVNSSGISIFKFICAGSCVTTVSAGVGVYRGILYDGSHIWVTENSGTLRKMNPNGSFAFSITVGQLPLEPVFDGKNIWVPNSGSDSVTVVRVKDSVGNPLAQPFVLATLTGNGLNGPRSATFDGQRILVTNFDGNSVSLWRATDLTPLASFQTGASSQPIAACSDGINFWIALSGTHQLARF